MKSYIVKDLFPDKRKKVDSWQVEPDKVIPFPALDNEVFETGNRVLSLWLENTEWSSMFYEAYVVQTLQKNDTTIKLKYNGDNKVYAIDKSKVIRYDDSKVVENIEIDPKKIKPAKQAKPSNVSTRSKVNAQKTTRSRKSMELESPSAKKVKRELSPPPLQLPSSYFEQKEARKPLAIENDRKEYFNPSKPTANRPLSVLGKKLRNYQNMLLERNNAGHQSMLLNFNFR